jgi:hypothetical protein
MIGDIIDNNLLLLWITGTDAVRFDRAALNETLMENSVKEQKIQ